ncbi:hypothetical protein NUW58_g1687 [Xylaria curta]|uniref:Uncharacterized protein n=1 Tax=Xylaria curta TaxID=42375 RepID=A0ACC1PLY1_9PEZI|nr:hypothetical protein NUW58_g1687 [Xylaria curta]
MDHDNSWGLLKFILGFIARNPPEKLKKPTSPELQALDAWLRADAYLQHETNDFAETSPEQVARALRTFENIVQYDSGQEPDSSLCQTVLYPKLQAARSRTQRQNRDTYPDLGLTTRINKRKREHNAAIEELSHLDMEAKKRRVLPREDPNMGDNMDEPEVDFAILMRKHSISLHQGLRTHWACVCQGCSALSVRLSLPQRKKGSRIETCFEVFFGVQYPFTFTLQEGKITVKDLQNDKAVGSSGLAPSVLPEFAHICQCITESLDQRNCLHLLFEDGQFKRLRPQPKTFSDFQMPRTVSLSTFFKHQKTLRGGLPVLPLKGKRILAVTLATALLPFLETPWVQPSFDHSKIQFFQPLHGELPNITKPFLALEQAPILSANKMNSRNGQAESASSKHMVHPNASVLALGILLCELHYCTPVESWQNGVETARNINTDYYTSLEMLKNLEVDAGLDYYLATKACLQWEYLPLGESASFGSASVQKLFYQNVVKRLESEIFKSWSIRLDDLNSLDSQENELCWGLIGRDVVRQQASKPEYSTGGNEELSTILPSVFNLTSPSYTLHNPAMIQQVPSEHTQSFQARTHIAISSTNSLYLFDASNQMVSTQDTGLSERWMDSLLTSIYHHVDPFDGTIQPFVGSVTNGPRRSEPVRIAILDSGFDSSNPLLLNDNGKPDPRIKGARNFVPETEAWDTRDEIGHGTHALGLLLKVATYIISMSFGIREYHEPMNKAISNALSNQTLMFAAASNDGGNLGRAFPAKSPGVFCIHSTDGHGNPSAFNPTADEKDVNFSLLGEHVRSHWPAGKNGHNDIVNVMSGTSVATPIAAGLAASVLSFVRQQERELAVGSNLLGPWLKNVHSMDAVLKSMVRQRRGYGGEPTSEPFPPMNAGLGRRELLPSILSNSPPGRSSTLPPLQRSLGPNRPRKQSITKRGHKKQKSRGSAADWLRRIQNDDNLLPGGADRKAHSVEPSADYGKRWEDLIDAAASATEDIDDDRTPWKVVEAGKLSTWEPWDCLTRRRAIHLKTSTSTAQHANEHQN